ncbi:MAG: hypothetical protein JXR49_07415 [Acidobacteria bacterium]|nr:hypothetical protein [Acidobacteriota bacterium]
MPRTAGFGIGIGIDRKIKNLFFQTYMQIPGVDSDPDTDPDPDALLPSTFAGTAEPSRVARPEAVRKAVQPLCVFIF